MKGRGDLQVHFFFLVLLLRAAHSWQQPSEMHVEGNFILIFNFSPPIVASQGFPTGRWCNGVITEAIFQSLISVLLTSCH